MNNLVYMTAANRDEALKLARILVAKKLCAGVNIVPKALSVYWWEDKIQEKEEYLLLAQVATKALSTFIATVKEYHSYQVPCIIALSIVDGYKPFLQWIENNCIGGGQCE